jgi:hypothetical protein
MLRAFFAASVTDLRAELTHLLSELRAARHFAHGERAEIRATAIQLDAPRHHLDVILMQTSGRTVFAGLHALMAGLDAVFVFFV